MRNLLLLLFATGALSALAPACEVANKPMDADTRQAIDSIVGAKMGTAQLVLDSLCTVESNTRLPHLIDSIKQQRLMEIERQLGNR